jgi:predicted negative regulator of RcsB-dependent stress response
LKNQPHMDRQHIKKILHDDDLSQWLLKARDWVRSHLETVVIGLLVISAVIFAVVFFFNGQKKKDLEASTQLSEAHQFFNQAGQVDPAQTVAAYSQAYAKFQAVATAYDGTVQASDAKLGMANAQFAMGKWADAEREYGALDSGDAKDPLAALAAFGRARSLEAQGKAADALTAYLAVSSHYPKGPATGLAEAAAKRLSPPAGPAKH